MSLTIHLLPNAHLDPVWLWDWREGLNEGLQTCATVLDLMDEDPSLTFIRGEAMIYRHVERHDPKTFSRIRSQIDAGRWDVVGGTLIQADNNLPCTETLIRQFVAGQTYFTGAFGKPVRAAWSADAFGHSAGLPEILAAGGIESFAFSRPGNDQMPMDSSAFWWEGPGGSRILSYRAVTAYLSERTGVGDALDQVLLDVKRGPLSTGGYFYGIGNHGGGPTRALQAQIAEWADAHPEVRLVPSGLHPFFEDLRAEIAKQGICLPVRRGELGFCLRGCYSSVARFKYSYRKTESHLLRAERCATVIDAFLGEGKADLDRAWDELLFNSFHDILPGSSIERAIDEQTAWLGSVELAAQRAEFGQLTALAAAIDTSVQSVAGDFPTAVPLLVWNPHPHVFQGHVEVETCLDYRPIFTYEGKASCLPVRVLNAGGICLPFQEIPTENTFMPQFPWRKRLLVPVTIPAMGWSVLEVGWVEGFQQRIQEPPLRGYDNFRIENEMYRLEAKIGKEGLRIWQDGIPIFGREGMSVKTYEDPWGSWGGLQEEPDSLDIDTVMETWTITHTHVMECGPERVSLWVRFSGKRSHLDLTCSLCRGRKAIDFKARAFWHERRARLKLELPFGNRAIFEVPGGTVERGPAGEVPGGRWVHITDGERFLGFASDALYNFDLKAGSFKATVLRSAGYATDGMSPNWEEPWRPVSDEGEHKFQFLFQPGDEKLPGLAAELEQPPIVQSVPAAAGHLRREGSLMSVQPECVRLLAVTPAKESKKWNLRMQADYEVTPELTWQGQLVELGKMEAGRIVTWQLSKKDDFWEACKIAQFNEKTLES